MISQKEAVFNAISAIITVDPSVQTTLTKEQRAQVCDELAHWFLAGDVVLSDSAKAKYDTQEKLAKKYCPGLVNNWLRKDTRLSGGVKWQTKNPGSRAGSGDDQIRELRKLKSTMTNPDHIAKVEAAITERLAELKAERNKQVDINVDALPEHLRDLVG